MSFNLGEFLKSINFDKNNMAAGDFDLKGYVPFIINRSLSYFPDTLGYVVAVSKYGENTPNSIHYLYLLNSIPSRKRFAAWHKQSPAGEIVEAIQVIQKVNRKRAEEYANILSPEQQKELLIQYKSIKD